MSAADYAVIPSETPQLVSGLLMLALAIAVLRVRFGSKLNRAFALYLVLEGFGDVWGAWDDTPAMASVAGGILPYFYLTSPVALAWLALRYREHAAGARPPRWAGPLLLAGAVSIVAAYAADHTLFQGVGGLRGPLFPFGWHGLGALLPALLAIHFALKSRRANDAERSGFLLAALAFSLEPAYLGGREAIALWHGAFPTAGLALSIAATLRLVALAASVVAALVLASDRRVRRASLAIAVAAATGFLPPAFGPPGSEAFAASGNALNGVWQLAVPLLLGYAIVRHQLLGLDVKVRWTISKSTIAAVFIAVFFVASEGAQQFFGESLGSTYVGIGAAGALVFAIAPLQRAAERLAESAVPPRAAGAGGATDSGNESIYRDALRLALRDRRLTREEEIQLHRLAEALGIRAARAHEMLTEVEREAGIAVGGAR